MLACYSCFFDGLDGQLDPNKIHGGCEVMSGKVSYKIDQVKEREHGDFMLIYGWLELLSWLFMKKKGYGGN